ncbi:UDP-N-acetylmuramate dehydrogenase [Aliikangiella sp. IMCC44632]
MYQVENKVELKSYNTMAVSATADTMLVVHSLAELQSAMPIIQANKNRLVLGGGSNLLFLPKVEGLVIYPQIFGKELLEETQDAVTIQVGASENWHDLVLYACAQGWYGLENLALIPGTVGAAPVQNIGAYGVEVRETIQQVNFVDLSDASEHQFNTAECQFAYRDSIFKRAEKGRYLITSVVFKLSKAPHFNLDYAPLKAYFAEQDAITANEVVSRVCQIRQSKLPDPKVLPNAGSFFKNPVISQQQYQALVEVYPSLVAYPQSHGVKIAAGWLIEKAGFKGKRVGDVGVHAHQALVLVNYAESAGEKLWELAQLIKASVSQQFGIELEAEVTLIGKQA